MSLPADEVERKFTIASIDSFKVSTHDVTTTPMNSSTTATLITSQIATTNQILELTGVCVSLLAIFVNACVILVIFIGPRAFRSPTFYLICSLAMADLLTGLTVITAFIAPMENLLWQRVALRGVSVACFSTSVNNLLVIAGERYVKIQNDPSYQRIFSSQNTIIFISSAWIFGWGIFALVPLVGWHCPSEFCKCPENTACFCFHSDCSMSFAPFTKSYLITGIIYYYVCLIVMLVIYLALFLHVRKAAGFKRQGSVVGPLPNHGPFLLIHKKREIKLTKILCVVMGAFFICWLPLTTLFIVDTSYTVDNKDNEAAGLITKSFNYCLLPAMIHPLLNPLIYSLKMPRMWSTFR